MATETRPPPKPGDLIYGCYHGGVACGAVERVDKHVTADGMDHWEVKESWNGRWTRVRREPNGLVYEVELVPSWG